jgi:hypothetical protein
MRRRSFPGIRGRGFVVSRRHQTYGRSRQNYGGRSPYAPTPGPLANGCSLVIMLGIAFIVIWLINAVH